MLNLDELRKNNKFKKELMIETFDMIYEQCCEKIKFIGAKNEEMEYYFETPDLIMGRPLYKLKDAISYVIDKLKTVGFTELKFYEPNIIYISWRE